MYYSAKLDYYLLVFNLYTVADVGDKWSYLGSFFFLEQIGIFGIIRHLTNITKQWDAVKQRVQDDEGRVFMVQVYNPATRML
jgi:hypothetical protein